MAFEPPIRSLCRFPNRSGMWCTGRAIVSQGTRPRFALAVLPGSDLWRRLGRPALLLCRCRVDITPQMRAHALSFAGVQADVIGPQT